MYIKRAGGGRKAWRGREELYTYNHSFAVSVVYIYTRFYVKILKQTYFVRVGQNGLPFRLQLSRCARAALPLSPFCILCVSKSFLHVCANPFNMAPTAGYLQQLLLHSLNTLANILALPVDCLLPSSSFLLPSSCLCLCLCLLQLLHLSIRRLIRLFNAFLRFCSTVGFCLLFIRSARGGRGGAGANAFEDNQKVLLYA